MDQFVQDQLNLIGCGYLIPVFQEKGYTEQSYRELNLGKLIRLFPKEEDEDLILKLSNSIKTLNGLAAPTVVTLFPAPKVVVKTEETAAEAQGTFRPRLEGPDDDDEVQVEKMIINAPSQFTRIVRIKTEPDLPDSTTPGPKSEPTPSGTSQEHGPIIVEGVSVKQEPEQDEHEPNENHEPQASTSDGSDNGQNQDSGIFNETVAAEDSILQNRDSSIPGPSPPPEEGNIRSRLRKRCQNLTQSIPSDPTDLTDPSAEESRKSKRTRTRCQTETSSMPLEETGTVCRRLRSEGQPKTAQTPDRSPEVESTSGRLGSLRRRILKVNISPRQEPQLRIRNVNMSNWRRWQQLKSFLDDAEPDSVKKRISDKLNFTFSNVDDFDEVLELLETHSSKLSTVLRRLEFYLTTPERDVSSLQVNRLSNLSETLWCQLTALVFKLTFTESVEFAAITTILKKCPNLKTFEIRRGVVLSGTDVKFIEIPRLDKLEIFLFGNELRLGPVSYREPASVVDVETDEFENEDTIVHFLVKFGKFKYPKLEILYVGPSIDLDFTNLAQFPKLQRFEPGHIRNRTIWEPKKNGPIYDQLLRLYLPAGITADIVEGLPFTFPNVRALYVLLPKVEVLRSMIRCLASMRLEVIELTVTYEFESALMTALRGQRFRAVTASDKMKLAKLKAYKNWEKFVKYLNMEIPPEAEEDATNQDDSSQESDTITIGSFKHLKTFHVHYFPRTVFMPEGDLHWNNPGVKICKKQWSSEKQKFPTCILLEELTKLKGTLKDINLPDFEVDKGVASKFHDVMGFKLRFDGVPEDKTTDLFVERELQEGTVKPERE